PASASGFAAAEDRFHTTTRWPASTSRRAIPAPIVPRPMNPTSAMTAPYGLRADRTGRLPFDELGGEHDALRLRTAIGKGAEDEPGTVPPEFETRQPHCGERRIEMIAQRRIVVSHDGDVLRASQSRIS